MKCCCFTTIFPISMVSFYKQLQIPNDGICFKFEFGSNTVTHWNTGIQSYCQCFNILPLIRFSFTVHEMKIHSVLVANLKAFSIKNLLLSVNFVALTLLFGLLKEPTGSHHIVNGSHYTMLFVFGYFSLLRFKCYCSDIASERNVSHVNFILMSFVIQKVVPYLCYIIIISQTELHINSDKINIFVHLHPPSAHTHIHSAL